MAVLIAIAVSPCAENSYALEADPDGPYITPDAAQMYVKPDGSAFYQQPTPP